MPTGRALAWTVASLISIPAITVAQSREDKRPDCSASEYRQFDFWIGAWEVFDTTGAKIGSNTIVPILKGCVLRESWLDTDGNAGESYSAYDRIPGSWHQTWVDERGDVWKIDGGLRGSSMEMTRRAPSLRVPGLELQYRWSWIPVDSQSVRQIEYVSRDSGRTWTTAFNGLYKRRSK